ncbi:hypothetical protein ACFYTC_01380 [Actinomadura nitritigenes]|uniref:hypothetical protein n=1 Tax=Actinomadura nitritigenes TaxID=134602 RepID=UPI0036840ECD
MPGDVPREPLPPAAASEDVPPLRLVRSGGSWMPRRAQHHLPWATLSSTRDFPLIDTGAELVGHRDYCPGSVVFRDRLPAAILADAFGMSAPQRRGPVPVAGRIIHRVHLTRRARYRPG